MTGVRAGATPGRAAGVVPGVEAHFATILQLSAGRPVFTADYYVRDASSNKVRAFVDHNDPTHLLQQTDTNLQIPQPQTHADFRGKLCADFPNLAGYVYTSNRAASYYTYLVDSSTSYIVLTPKGTAFALWTECADSTSDWSMVYNTSVRAEAARLGISNLVNSGGSVTVDKPLAMEWLVNSAAPKKSLKTTGRAEVSAASVLGVLESMPNTLTIGGRTGLGFGFANMRWPFLFVGPALTDAQRAALAQALFGLYGVSL